MMKTAFSIIFNISCDYNEIQTIKSSSIIENFNELYKNISQYQEGLTEVNIQYSKLKPTLRKYQIDAVRWMIQREQKLVENEMLHPLYEEVVLKSGVKIYFDKYTGYIDLDKPMAMSLRTGGILADEMGLGKTVEVLACMLSHPYEKSQCMRPLVQTTTTWPVIIKQTRKREIHVDKVDETPEHEDSAKKLKVPEGWVKPKSKKPAYKIALDAWYESELNFGRKDIVIPKVQCICGNTDERSDCVQCVDCTKIQHSRCLGYKSTYGEYICPQCWMIRPSLESGATLIVTPYSLKQQWCDEILKHIDGVFRVFLYEGGLNRVPVYPKKFLEYDLVITTYSVLQSELRLSESGQVMSLRRPPKYSLPGSPITLIKWWRLCLDEAQTVETPGRMVSEMAKRIQACHRWAVTGTPISKDISDLYGLIDYLQLAPYSEFDTWNNLFYKPYINGRKELMHKFLSKILWRTSKLDVEDQINIPQQTVVEHWLDFSDVEMFFYQREHNLCSKEFLTRLKEMDLNMLLCSLNKSILKKLMRPLLALRQACCHHQAVKSKYIATRKQFKLSKNIVRLQLIHTMHNLSEVCEIYPAIPPTLRDASLGDECKALEKEYMERFMKQTLSALNDSWKFSKKITKLQKEFKLNPGQWFADMLDWITLHSLFEEYLMRLANTMHSANVIVKNMNERRVLYMIAQWDEEITELKEQTIRSIHQLFEMTEEGETKIIIPNEVMEAATDCHLRPQSKQSKKKKKCPLCDANFYLKQYESKIFNTTQKDDDISNTGTWKPAPEEFMLRTLSALGKQKNVSAELLHDADIHFHILDLLKKEFKEIRKLWTYVDAQVCAKDEVDMCKMRLRLKEKSDKKESDRSKINRIVKQLSLIEQNPYETIHMLDEHEVAYQRAVLAGEYKTNTVALDKNLGTYKYLQTLQKQQTTGQTPDPCPICKNTLEKQWNILPCGHCYCLECIQVLLGQTSGDYISCSVCRSRELLSDITLVDTENQKKTSDEVQVRGNHSTKVEAVVRLVMKLRQDEENVKVLVFSTWTVILKHNNFDKTLERFKDESQRVTALLLPVHLGSKGLNLIEATHVIFVEPLLNPGDELQAIGRIHRIGQTKPTVIHKFFIRNTIEENIYHATAGNAKDWDSNTVTLGRIKRLFEVDPNSILQDSTSQEENDGNSQNLDERSSV
ncbi:hypothetical protein Trydic_g21610 [Trypoxylus dichotomus]